MPRSWDNTVQWFDESTEAQRRRLMREAEVAYESAMATARTIPNIGTVNVTFNPATWLVEEVSSTVPVRKKIPRDADSIVMVSTEGLRFIYGDAGMRKVTGTLYPVKLMFDEDDEIFIDGTYVQEEDLVVLKRRR